MRVVRVLVPDEDLSVVRSTLDEEGVDDVVLEQREANDGSLVEFPIPAEAVDFVMAELDDAGVGDEHRVVLGAESVTTTHYDDLSLVSDTRRVLARDRPHGRAGRHGRRQPSCGRPVPGTRRRHPGARRRFDAGPRRGHRRVRRSELLRRQRDRQPTTRASATCSRTLSSRDADRESSPRGADREWYVDT
jgi:hypothetical protein